VRVSLLRTTQRFSALLSLCLSAQSFGADPIYLFPPNPSPMGIHEINSLKPVAHYEALVKNLTPGDELAFEDGNRFEFISHVGHGGTCNILKVRALTGPDKGKIMALRIPISGELLSQAQHWDANNTHLPFNAPENRYTFSTYIQDTSEYLDLFARAGIGPKAYLQSPGQYIALDLIDVKFTLDDFLSGKISLAPEEESTAEDALVFFERKIAGIQGIKDIGQPGNLVFDGTRWILVDWYGVYFISERIYPWAFYEWPGLIEEVLDFKMHEKGPISVKDPRHPFWSRLKERLSKTHKKARLDMLELAVNPLTRKPLNFQHSYFERNFGSWKKIYHEMNRTKKERLCTRALTS